MVSVGKRKELRRVHTLLCASTTSPWGEREHTSDRGGNDNTESSYSKSHIHTQGNVYYKTLIYSLFKNFKRRKKKKAYYKGGLNDRKKVRRGSSDFTPHIPSSAILYISEHKVLNAEEWDALRWVPSPPSLVISQYHSCTSPKYQLVLNKTQFSRLQRKVHFIAKIIMCPHTGHHHNNIINTHSNQLLNTCTWSIRQRRSRYLVWLFSSALIILLVITERLFII